VIYSQGHCFVASLFRITSSHFSSLDINMFMASKLSHTT